MSLSSALFSGISGLNTLGNSMTVIGDNIANVNTVGFKASRVTFQDVLSQTVATTAGTAQVGRGTSLADITSSFAQGSFDASANLMAKTMTASRSDAAVWKFDAGGMPDWKLSATVGCPDIEDK